MKKFFLVLSIALVFTLCAFAVTSCGDDHEHTWGTAYTVDKNASCTEAGQKSIKCTVCDEIMPGSEIEISASHTWSTELTVDKEASCTEAGQKSIKCTVCGESNAASVVVIPASHKWGSEITVDRAATCSAEGQKSIKCTVCNQPNPATVTAIPTVAHEWNSKSTVDKAATCTEDGQESVKCKNCKAPDPESVKVIPAAHTWNLIPTVDVEATCTSDGQMSTKCKICKEMKPGSEIKIAGGHKWDDAATVDFAATCTSDGQKSVKCTTCGSADPDSITVIEASHDYSAVYTKVYATAFNDGLREGVCAACQTPISEQIPATEVNIIAFSTSTSTYKSSVPLSSVLAEGEHFYPTLDDPDGKDLYVEYSILLNKTMDNLVGNTWAISGIRNDDSGNGNTPYWFYFSPSSKWCPYKGGFEADGVGELLFGAPCNDVTNPDGFVVLEDYYGWHRFGWKLHQDTYIEDGKVVYKMTTSLYVDGVKVHEMVSSNWLDENNLYFATIEDGKLVYSDNTNPKKCVFLFRMEKPYTSDGSTAHIPIADLYVSGGSDFVLPILPVSDPAPDTYEVSGIKLDGRSHFTVSEVDKTQPHEHVWSNMATVDKNATCSEAGQKSYKCAICGEVDADRVVNIPKNANHDVDTYKTILEGTIFSQGIKEGKCTVCGETDTKVIPITSETVRKLTSTSPSRIVHNYDMLAVLNGDHFYPTEEDPDGKDLYIELSLLWNESLLKTSSGLMSIGRISLSNTNDGNGFYYLNFVDEVPGSDCSYSGGFESGSKKKVIDGPSLENGGNKSDFPFIGEYGWHRIGVRVHQEVSVSDGRVVYEVTSYLYVDGEVVSSQICDVYDTNLLYYAVIGSDGELEYYDNDQNSRYIYAFRLDGFNTANADDSAYLITADVHVTCGNDFVVPVEKADSPVAKDYVTNGETFDGTVYFDTVIPDDIVFPEPPCSEHRDADDDGVCDSDGCTYICIDGCDVGPCVDANDDGYCDSKACNNRCTDGCDTKPCVDRDGDGYCDNEDCDKPTTNKPTTCEHDLLNYTVTVPATMFTKGEKVAHCSVCNEEITVVIDETVPTVLARSSSLSNNNTNMKVWYTNVPLASLTDEDTHFYPTKDDADGKSLLVEFSMLINESFDLATKNGKAWFIPGAISREDGYSKSLSEPFYIHIDENDTVYCPHTGGIENGFTVEETVENAVAGSVGNYYVMKNYYGWHRFAVKYDQVTEVNGSSISYTMYVTLYIDGVKTMTVVSEDWIEENLLYTAELVNGNLVYEDNKRDDRKVTAAILQYFIPEDGTMYVPVADAFITCGDSFVMSVTNVAEPEEATFEVANGYSVDAKMYFELGETSDEPDEPVTPPAPTCDHDSLTYTTLAYATMFCEGEKVAYCDVCGEVIYATVAVTTPDIVARSSSLSNNNTNMKVWYGSASLKELTDDKTHFYPTEDDADGKSLLVEFSMLINETFDLESKNGKAWFIPGAISREDGYSKSLSEPFYIHIDENDTTYCPHTGGIENGFTVEETVENAVAGSVGNYYVMKNYYGWHRFGVRYTQNTEIVDGEAVYTMHVTLYIDGVKTMTVVSEDWIEENLLYTAELDGEDVVYFDNKRDDRKVTAAILQYFIPKTDEMYVPMADMFISCGDEFIMNVATVDDPEAEAFELTDGYTVDAKTYFELVGVAEIVCNHVDKNDDGECDNLGCDQIYFDGCDVVDCEDIDGDEVCDNTGCTKPVKAPVPAVCDHVNLPYVTTVYPTVFSTGVKTAHCDVCGEDFTEQIDEKDPLIIRRTSSNTGVLKNGIAINELLDEGEHFYPTEDDPDGKSLFVEYSILLNETLDLAEGACLALPGFRDASSGNSNGSYWFYFRGDYEPVCPFQGGFEVNDYDEIVFGKTLKNTDKREDHIVLDDYYGWHRFGVEFHQDTRIEGNTVKYSMTITLYIDGVKTSAIKIGDDWQEKNLLYTASIVNGKLVYSDSTVSDRYLYLYRIEKLYDAEGEIVYLPLADLYVSCADEPLLNVTPVTDPEDAYFEVESGVSLFAPVHFEYNQ